MSDERAKLLAEALFTVYAKGLIAFPGGNETESVAERLLASPAWQRLVESIREEERRPIEDACPVCRGEGWTQETQQDEDGKPYPVQVPCWDAEHSVILAARSGDTE